MRVVDAGGAEVLTMDLSDLEGAEPGESDEGWAVYDRGAGARADRYVIRYWREGTLEHPDRRVTRGHRSEDLAIRESERLEQAWRVLRE